MFTLAEIEQVHARLGRADTLTGYLRGLADLGVVRFESFVADGHSVYYAADGSTVVSPPYHDRLDVAEVSDRSAFLAHLRRHSDGETSYVEMSAGLAASGVEKWVADTAALTMSYCDRAGATLLVEDAGGGPDPDAVPAVQPDAVREPVLFTLEVDGERFAVRRSTGGGTDYDWLTGPNAGYGFGETGPVRSPDEHREAIRSFLRQVDPATGFIGDD